LWKGEQLKSTPPPPYYNVKDTNNSNSHGNINNDGVIVSSEGYSYVTEVPSLSSSQQRHSKKIDFHQSSSVGTSSTPQGANAGAPGYENMRPQGGAVGDPGYQNTREPSGFQNPQSTNNSQHRQRRTQRKVTHNEKRYHSGK